MSAPAFISKLETFAKIEAAHFLIGHERLWAARKKHLSIINDAGAINDIERFPHIMIGDEHADATLLELANEIANVGDGDGIDPCERFVKQIDRRPGGERAWDRRASCGERGGKKGK